MQLGTQVNRLTQDLVRSLFHYSSENGELVWKQGQRSGMRAGCKTNNYRQIKIKNISYYEHIIIWVWMTGTYPENEIDHKDTNGMNNRWGNLREATHEQNAYNRNGWKTKTLPKGIRRMPNGKYVARIGITKKRFYLGIFNTVLEAKTVYDAKAIELFGEFRRVV